MTYWNIKFYDAGDERETLREITLAKKEILMSVFEREGVHAAAMKYNDEGTEMLEHEVVNKPEVLEVVDSGTYQGTEYTITREEGELIGRIDGEKVKATDPVEYFKKHIIGEVMGRGSYDS